MRGPRCVVRKEFPKPFLLLWINDVGLMFSCVSSGTQSCNVNNITSQYGAWQSSPTCELHLEWDWIPGGKVWCPLTTEHIPRWVGAPESYAGETYQMILLPLGSSGFLSGGSSHTLLWVLAPLFLSSHVVLVGRRCTKTVASGLHVVLTCLAWCYPDSLSCPISYWVNRLQVCPT